MVRKETTITIIGDRVLIRPDSSTDRTSHGLYLPPTVGDKDPVQAGQVIKVGPGYPIPNPSYSEDEPWAPKREQTREGDRALFLRKEAVELEYNGERLPIVSQPAILMLVREELHEE